MNRLMPDSLSRSSCKNTESSIFFSTFFFVSYVLVQVVLQNWHDAASSENHPLNNHVPGLDGDQNFLPILEDGVLKFARQPLVFHPGPRQPQQRQQQDDDDVKIVESTGDKEIVETSTKQGKKKKRCVHHNSSRIGNHLSCFFF